ncbi:MAG: tetratricopeptide repeat protein [Terracidiphilus sp.]
MGARQSTDSSEIQKLLARAVAAHQAGRLEEAQQLYLQILAINVKHAKSLYGIGLIAHQAGNLDAAAKMMQRAIAVSPGDAAFHASLGAVLRDQGRHDEALAEYATVLRSNPKDEDAHFNVADIFREQTRFIEAEQHYRRALELRPNSTETYQNLGIVLRRMGRIEEAARAFGRALELDPNNVAALNNVGNLLLSSGDAQGARGAFQRVVELAPQRAEARNGLGAALQDLGALDAADASYREALRCKPDYAEAHCNLGNLARRRGDLDAAEQNYNRALSFNPNLPEAHSNLGMIAQNRCRLDEARQHYNRAVALDPGSPDARWSLCLLDLLEGKLETGWKDYEVRYARKQSAPRAVPGPLWRGEALNGARILLFSEQGLGDTFQFLRYVPLVKAAGGTILLDVQPAVRRLAAEIPGITVLTEGALPAFEWQCPLMGLPLAFATTLQSIPHQVPYLTAPADARDAAGSLDWPAHGLRAGIVWSGNPDHKEDRYRSIPLQLLEPLLQAEGVHFFSLQLGPASAQLAATHTQVTDLQSAIRDFADTAALITHLDLVITVDTAVAHLAGALGKPTWLLLPFAPDWRWLMNREDTPWYPTMRLFRPQGILQWGPVLECVRAELIALVSAHSAR